jgi:hypothetical protein
MSGRSGPRSFVLWGPCSGVLISGIGIRVPRSVFQVSGVVFPMRFRNQSESEGTKGLQARSQGT